MDKRQRIEYLVKAATGHTATGEELQELADLVKRDETFAVTAQIEELLKSHSTERTPLTPGEIEILAGNVLRADQPGIKEPAKVISIWKRVAVAASVIMVLSIGSYMFFNKTQKQIVTAETKEIQNDVAAPQSNKAVLTLADGSTIVLDSASNGSLAVQGNVKIEKTKDGQIVYNGDATEVKYNTLTVPKGSKPVQLKLADGSEVWLNVASSITYPTAFAGNERKVQMTGEVYFEVAHDASKPFTASVKGMDVQVLGTHFNINAYDDENTIRTTLLEGSVKVSNKILKPGQQAQVVGNDIKIAPADVDEVMAWKNGEFQFGDKTDINTIMRQISRWYDVEVEYKGKINGHIGGSISRGVNVSQVLKMLEKTGGVRFRIEGEKIIVMP